MSHTDTMDNKERHNEDWLSKLPKDSGFDIPKGYFDSVEDDFSARLREESLPDTAGFEVPKGYFDSLENRILDQVEMPKQGKVISLRSRILRVASIAAVFAILLTTYISLPNTIEEPTSDEIAAWIDENIGEVYTDDILDAFDEVANLDGSFLETSIENNNIEKYLDENDTYILIEESQGLFDEIN